MWWFEGLLLLGSLGYFLAMMRLERGIPRAQRDLARSDRQPLVSVVVAARNEAAGITALLTDLAAQTYPAASLEVLVVDDRSSDGTAELVESFILTHGLANMRCLRHRPVESEQPTYKKHALRFAIEASHGEIILTTDADCSLQPEWVAGMVQYFTPDTGLVAGLAAYQPQACNVFHELQTLEFAGLVFCGVGAIGLGNPLICNASNLAYRRAAFDEVGGFAGHEHVPSGDDDLFMQNIHHKTAWRIGYCLLPETIVYTRPVDTIMGFLNQRARWGSKGRDYPGVASLLFLLAVYGFYVGLFLGILLVFSGMLPWPVFLLAMTFKMIPEFLILRRACTVFGQQRLLVLFPFAQFLQILYIVLAGFAGFFRLYNWKGST